MAVHCVCPFGKCGTRTCTDIVLPRARVRFVWPPKEVKHWLPSNGQPPDPRWPLDTAGCRQLLPSRMTSLAVCDWGSRGLWRTGVDRDQPCAGGCCARLMLSHRSSYVQCACAVVAAANRNYGVQTLTVLRPCSCGSCGGYPGGFPQGFPQGLPARRHKALNPSTASAARSNLGPGYVIALAV